MKSNLAEDLKIDLNAIAQPVNEISESTQRDSVVMQRLRTEFVNNKTYVRTKEIRDGFKLSAESYRRMRKYQPEEKARTSSVQRRTDPKPQSLAARLREIQAQIDADRVKDLGIVYIDAPRQIRTGSKWDSIQEIRRLRMQQMFDHKKFNTFLASKFGQYLLEGIDDPDLEKQGITRVSQFIKEKKTYYKAVRSVKNDVCAMPKQSMVYAENYKTAPSRIDKKSPLYLQELQKMFNANQFCKSAQKMFEFYHEKLQNTVLTVDESQRIQKVIVKELKQHTFLTSNKTLTVEQLIRRLEEVGPDTLEIDLKKELKRWIIVMHVFQSFLMMMGLPWKDINLENLDKKMNILDKLTKDDLRKFMVDLRPELLDDAAVTNENEKKAKVSKMKVRLARKNPKDKDDKYDILMKQTAVVISEIMKKRRRKPTSTVVTRNVVSPKSSSQRTGMSDDQATSLVNIALQLGVQNLVSPSIKLSPTVSGEPTPKKTVVFNEPLRSPPEQIIEESQSLVTSSSESSSDDKPDPFANVPRVYANPYATLKENYILQMSAQNSVIQRNNLSRAASTTPMYDPVIAMQEATPEVSTYKLQHRGKVEALKEAQLAQQRAREAQRVTQEQLAKELKQIQYFKEIEKQATEYDAEAEKKKKQLRRRMTKVLSSDVVKADVKRSQDIQEEKQQSTKVKAPEVTQPTKVETQPVKEPQRTANSNRTTSIQKQNTISINELQETLRRRLSIGAKQFEELTKNEEFLKNLPRQSRPKTVKVGDKESRFGLTSNQSNEKTQAGDTMASYGFKTPLQQSRVTTENVLASVNQPNSRNTRSAVFYRTQRVQSLAASNSSKPSDPRIMSSTRFQKNAQEKRLDDQIKFAKILHENRVKYFQKERVKSAVQQRRNHQLQSFENSKERAQSRNSVHFATQSMPMCSKNSRTQLKPQAMDIKANWRLTEATSGKQSVEDRTERTESQETESAQGGDSVNIGQVQLGIRQPRPKSSGITVNSRRSGGSKRLSALGQQRNETASRITALNELILRGCDEIAAGSTQETTEDIYNQHEEIIKVIENMQEKNEIACFPFQLCNYNAVLDEIHHEKRNVEANYLGKDALKAFEKSNKEVSLYLMKMKKLTKEQKLWRAEPIVINRMSELGKVLAAHN